MLNKVCNIVRQNKNVLMLLSAMIYVFALIAVLSGQVLLVSFLFSAILIFLLMKKFLPIKHIIVWVILFFVGVANTSIRLKDTDDLLDLAPANCEISGTIVSIPQNLSENKPKFFFDVDKIKIESFEKDLQNEKVLVTLNVKEIQEDFKIYDSLVLKGRLAIPFKAGNPSQFDYGNYLRNHNAYAVFYAKTFTKLYEELSLKAKILQGISDYRDRILKIHSQYLKSPNLEILGGIVFGDDAVSPPKEIKKSFANSGLLHILAASGMNVAFIYAFFFWLFSRLQLNYKLRVIFGMFMVIIYALMTGLGASIIRATGMLIFVLVGKLIDRDAHSISLLSFVGLLMLFYNPLFINDVGFQLSFIVTFGILLMAPTIIRFNNKILDYLVATVSIPALAQLWVIPVQIFYFSNISLYSIFANIMSVPILAVLSFGGFISVLLSAITPIANIVCKMFDFLLNPLLSFLVNISDFWGHLPNSSIQTTHPNSFQILIYYIMLLCITGLLNKEIREKYFKKLILSIITLFLILLFSLIPVRNNNLEIIAFDVGNADSFLIKTPSNEYIMIDTGKSGYKGGKSQAEIVLLKYLKDRGIKNLEVLVVTHFDNDHCGGAVDILNDMRVNRLYVNDLSHESYSAKAIYKIAKLNNTDIVLAMNNQIIYDNSGLKLTNLLGASSDNDNENSIITLLEYKNFTMLFTGDVGVNGIKENLAFIPANIDVLKVPHHGAIDGLNKEIVEYLNPKYSLISVGENRFGHPAVYVLKLLSNSRILRTDINNSILLKVNKSATNLYTYDLGKRKYLKLFNNKN